MERQRTRSPAHPVPKVVNVGTNLGALTLFPSRAAASGHGFVRIILLVVVVAFVGSLGYEHWLTQACDVRHAGTRQQLTHWRYQAETC